MLDAVCRRSMAEKSNTTNAMFMRMLAIGDTIHKLGQIPEGHLYAQVMGKMTVDEFNLYTGLLIKNKLVKRQHNILHWIG